jgi:chorismate mutase
MDDFEIPAAKKKTQPKLPVIDPKVETPVEAKAPEQEKPKYDPEELLRIFDDMIFAGSYSENVNIRGKLKVTFTTRSAEQMADITRQLDTQNAQLMATLVERRNLLNLYHGLTAYQGTDLSGLKYDEKVAFINRLPAPLVGIMMVSLFDFDSKIQAATQEGEANF